MRYTRGRRPVSGSRLVIVPLNQLSTSPHDTSDGIMQSPKTSTTGSRRAWWKTGIRRIVSDHELWTTTAAELGGVEAGSRERFRILGKQVHDRRRWRERSGEEVCAVEESGTETLSSGSRFNRNDVVFV